MSRSCPATLAIAIVVTGMAGGAPAADAIPMVARFAFESADEFKADGRKIDGNVVFGQAGPRRPRAGSCSPPTTARCGASAALTKIRGLWGICLGPTPPASSVWPAISIEKVGNSGGRTKSGRAAYYWLRPFKEQQPWHEKTHC